MLKSTHRPLPESASDAPPLPSGWTEHKAPTGHAYYYNAETKQSTYTRPVAPQAPYLPNQNLHLFANHPDGFQQQQQQQQQQLPRNSNDPSALQSDNRNHYTRDNFQRANKFQDRRQREDRPKSKHDIPGCAPWVLVKTKYGRRFVHNLDTKESLWKFPQHVIDGVVEYDIQERQRKERRERGEVSEEREMEATNETSKASAAGRNDDEAAEDESDEYEEVEVTDSEFEEDADGSANKRQKQDGDGDEGAPATMEFGEDDMAYQLAELGQGYQLDAEEYGEEGPEDEEWEDDGLRLTEAEAKASFEDLLDDHAINPFATWDGIIAEGRIIDDDRYTLLPNMKSRKETFAEWSTKRIQRIKQEKESQAKQDPRIPYLAFLQEYATPKLYWPEFRRKFKKEAVIKDSKLADKDREKLYREHINRITKVPEPTLKSELTALLQSIPASTSWNRSSTVDGSLPTNLIADLRYISLKSKVREAVIAAHIATLPPASQVENTAEETAEEAQRRAERQKREQAIKERERAVQEVKLQQRRNLAHGKELLREEEAEIQRAMKVGRGGLKGHLEGAGQDSEE